MRRPVAEILAEAERDNWPTSSIDAMAKHDLQDETDEQPHTSIWFTPTQPIDMSRGIDEQHRPEEPPARRQVG